VTEQAAGAISTGHSPFNTSFDSLSSAFTPSFVSVNCSIRFSALSKIPRQRFTNASPHQGQFLPTYAACESSSFAPSASTRDRVMPWVRAYAATRRAKPFSSEMFQR
jgi:hypothetical protein